MDLIQQVEFNLSNSAGGIQCMKFSAWNSVHHGIQCMESVHGIQCAHTAKSEMLLQKKYDCAGRLHLEAVCRLTYP